MGVQNLWVLLAPVGRQIEIESLAGQVLAVDASIWLTQFVKAMRDDEGNMIRNAHLMGTLHRVAKLLYYGVRPVFVFDGQTPEIKKRTTARRRKRQEQQTANLRHTAQRILLNRLKQHRQEMKKNGGASTPAAAPGFTLPVVQSKKKIEDEEKKDVKSEIEDEKRVENVTAKSEQTNETEKNGEQMVWEVAAEQEGESDDLTLDDIDLDTSRLSKLDLHAVFSLPPHLQKDMIQKILRDRRQAVRDQFIPLAGNPEKYSLKQISAFLQTSALNRRIEAAKRQNREKEMEYQGGVGQGQRIDSNSNRFYIYQNDSERKEENDDAATDVEPTGMAEGSSVTKSLKSSDVQVNAFKPAVKYEKVSDVNATEVTAAWVARHQIRVKQEPILAIEKMWLNKRKKHKPVASVKAATPNVGVMQLPVSDVSVSLKLDDVDPGKMAQFQKLFAASSAAPVVAAIKSDVDDEDNDVDWEEVATPTPELPSNSIPSSENEEQEVSKYSAKIACSPPSETVSLAAEKDSTNEKAESDDGMEWEDVNDEVIAAGAVSKDAQSEENISEQEVQQSLDSGFRDQLNVDQVADDAGGTEELFLTLKDEMEDAKGRGDLDLLKDEAMQSAMATASNLTQWAAGAVRRALQAHSLQHGGRIRACEGPAAVLGKKLDRQNVSVIGAAEDPLELSSGEENEPKSASHDDTLRTEVAVIEGDEDATQVEAKKSNEAKDSEKQLQATLTASIATDQEAPSDQASGARVRYLQYSQPSESPLLHTPMEDRNSEMDAAALQKEQLELKKLRSRQLRDTEGITDDMVAEVMALLRLFGVPFLVSPMEAEAQCAALEQLGLVDGVITDDSDIFPFGGQRVYKNIFHHQKFVEAFSARDIERELGFTREQIIALALLLGSDYTDGVRGIGIVNATEIAACYPGIEGLHEFKEWVREFDVAEEAERIASKGSKKKKKKGNQGKGDESVESDEETARQRFQRSHAAARRKWELGDEFPSKQVVQAYMAPQVDRSDARFSWSAPDLAALRNYCAEAFGWDQQKSDGILQPLEEKAKAATSSGSTHIQTRLDQFFTSYDDRVHYAQIKSKRLRSAVSQGTSSKRKKPRK